MLITAIELTEESTRKCQHLVLHQNITWIIQSEALRWFSIMSISTFHHWRAGKKKNLFTACIYCSYFCKFPFPLILYPSSFSSSFLPSSWRRMGTNVDSENLFNSLRNLHFDVSMYKDFKYSEMIAEVANGNLPLCL
jgi:hypothetical protein